MGGRGKTELAVWEFKIPPESCLLLITIGHISMCPHWESRWKIRFSWILRPFRTPSVKINDVLTKIKWIHEFKFKSTQDFPGGSVVKTLCFHFGGQGFDPWLGDKDSTYHLVWPKIKKKKFKPACRIRKEFKVLENSESWHCSDYSLKNEQNTASSDAVQPQPWMDALPFSPWWPGFGL